MKYLRKLELRLVPGTFRNPIKGEVREPAQVFSVFRDIKDWTKETLIGVFLSSDLDMNSYAILSVGGGKHLPGHSRRDISECHSHPFSVFHPHP